MAATKSLAEKLATGECVHCVAGFVYEEDPDTGEDAALRCHVCERRERAELEAERELDAVWSCLERMGL